MCNINKIIENIIQELKMQKYMDFNLILVTAEKMSREENSERTFVYFLEDATERHISAGYYKGQSGLEIWKKLLLKFSLSDIDDVSLAIIETQVGDSLFNKYSTLM